ncbi:MAG: hypothetical protein FWE10_05340 [Rikenellaceae bacterium]|nr:hypothetical protein [Rikenellaceae bacterium]MCL2693297.1 hypothetical protein [Rikenellaceae bacterium]
MKRYSILLLLVVVAIWGYSCTQDDSLYEPQQREEVAVDDFDDTSVGGIDPQPGVLVPGIYEVRLNVVQPDGETVQRRFKYFMPSTIVSSQPISLVIQFHDEVRYAWGVEPDDPIWNISMSSTLNQTAMRRNWITCFPVSGRTTNADASGQLNWGNTENELAYIDAILDYFATSTPTVDISRIHATGAGAGGNFLFQLALARSDRFASIVPYPATYSIPNDAPIPPRAVPTMMVVLESASAAALTNMGRWAERVGGYFAADRMLQENVYAEDFMGYATVNLHTWSGARADMQLFVVRPDSPSGALNITRVMPYMAEFMNSHSLDAASVSMFVTVGSREIVAQVGQTFNIPFNCTAGATVMLEGAPPSWSPTIVGNSIRLTAPADFFADVARRGEFTVRATLGGQSATTTVSYELQPPKTFFEAGDIYYNAAREPMGVVVWVDNANIREAIIMNLEDPDPSPNFRDIAFGGLGIDFDTPDQNDGWGNTAAMMAKNATRPTPFTASNSAFVWASRYSYRGVDGWYLPAVNELAAVHPNVAAINASLSALGAELLLTNVVYFSSTTEVTGPDTKLYHTFHFGTGVKGATARTAAQETAVLWAHVRAFKKVSL